MRRHAAISSSGGLLSLLDVFIRKRGGGVQYKFYDTFTDTSGTLLTSHTPDVDNLTGGNGWQSGFYNEIEIQNNEMVKQSTSYTALIYLSPGIGLSDAPYTIEYSLYIPASETNYIYFYCPYKSPDSGDDILFRIDPSLSAEVYLSAKDGGVNIWTKSTPSISDWFNTDAWNTVKFEFIADGTARYLKLWINDVLRADSSPNGDNVNLSGIGNDRLEFDLEASAGYRIDDFKVY